MKVRYRWAHRLLLIFRNWGSSFRVRFARIRGKYHDWVDRELHKNEVLKKKGDDRWTEVKQLWREHRGDR